MAELQEAHLRYLLAKDLLRCVEVIRKRLPAMELALTKEEAEEYIQL